MLAAIIIIVVVVVINYPRLVPRKTHLEIRKNDVFDPGKHKF